MGHTHTRRPLRRPTKALINEAGRIWWRPDATECFRRFSRQEEPKSYPYELRLADHPLRGGKMPRSSLSHRRRRRATGAPVEDAIAFCRSDRAYAQRLAGSRRYRGRQHRTPRLTADLACPARWCRLRSMPATLHGALRRLRARLKENFFIGWASPRRCVSSEEHGAHGLAERGRPGAGTGLATRQPDRCDGGGPSDHGAPKTCWLAAISFRCGSDVLLERADACRSIR